MPGQCFRSLRTVVAYALLFWAAIGTAHASLSARVEGLPGGLQVTLHGQWVVCTNGSAGFRNAGLVQLTEGRFTTIDRVTLPSGLDTYVSTTHVFYTGTLAANPLSGGNGCGTSIANG